MEPSTTTLDRLTQMLEDARGGDVDAIIAAIERDLQCAACLNTVDREKTKSIRTHIGCQHPFHGQCFIAISRLTAVAVATARASPAYKTKFKPRIPCRVCFPDSVKEMCELIDANSETAGTNSRTMVAGILAGKTAEAPAKPAKTESGRPNPAGGASAPGEPKKRRLVMAPSYPTDAASEAAARRRGVTSDDSDSDDRDSDLDTVVTEKGTKRVPPHKKCAECHKRCKPTLPACWSCGRPF